MLIKNKLLAAFIIISLLMGILGISSLYHIHKISQPLNEEIPDSISQISNTSRLNDLAQFIRYYDEVLTQSARNYAFTKDKRWEERYSDMAPKLDKIIKEAIAFADSKDKKSFESIDEANIALAGMEIKAIELVNQDNSVRAIEILESEEYWRYKEKYELGFIGYINRKGSDYSETSKDPTNALDKAVKKVSDKIKSSANIIIILYTLIILFSIIFGWFITKNIVKSITELNKTINNVNIGNFDSKIEKIPKDELGGLASSLNYMIKEIKNQRSSILKHEKELERTVKERTKELNKKVKESEDIRKATMNIMEDIDDSNRELIKAKEQLQKYVEELKIVDQKKDEFISVAAHELKTPLTSIRGFANLLQNPAIKLDKEKSDKYFRIIEKETIRLGGLITDILDLSRIDLGTMKFTSENIKVENLIKEIKDQMDIIIIQKGIKSVYQVEKGMPVISIDKERFIQVISNLINNAVHYTEEGGKITLKVSREDNYIAFSVIDTGHGIPKSQQEKIFERFYQVDSSYTRKIGGTGLGLALSKGIIETLGGNITVSSEVEKGSTFTITVPIKKLKDTNKKDEK